MPIPILYRKSGEGAVASYDYANIADGIGVVDFMGACACTGAATYDYFLTTNASFVSAKGGSAALVNGDNSLTFDVQFNANRYASGTAFVSVPFALVSTPGGAASPAYIKARLYHVDAAAAEVAISSEITSETLSCPAGDSTTRYVKCVVEVPLTSYLFKKGEKLRLKLVANWVDGAGDQYGTIGFSPSNQVPLWTSSRMDVFVPFRIASSTE